MWFRKRKGMKDPEMLRIDEQCRIIHEATNCTDCDDKGVKVVVYIGVYNPDAPLIEYIHCPCGAPVHPKLMKYLENP